MTKKQNKPDHRKGFKLKDSGKTKYKLTKAGRKMALELEIKDLPGKLVKLCGYKTNMSWYRACEQFEKGIGRGGGRLVPETAAWIMQQSRILSGGKTNPIVELISPALTEYRKQMREEVMS